MRITGKLCFGLMLPALAGILAVGAPRASAQPPPGGGGFQPSPQMMAKFKAWQKWRDSHKNISNLQLMIYQIGQMDKDPTTKLTKPQAAKIVSAITPWRTKPTMTDDQAKG